MYFLEFQCIWGRLKASIRDQVLHQFSGHCPIFSWDLEVQLAKFEESFGGFSAHSRS